MNLRVKTLLIGGVIGTLLGVLGAWLYYNANVQLDTEGVEQLEVPAPGDGLKVGLGVLGVFRQLTG